MLRRGLQPLHRRIWADPGRRARKLLRFAATEADGARDIARAAELTRDPVLRLLYYRHAADEHRHATAFRARAFEILRANPPVARREDPHEANWLAPGERGPDELAVDKMNDAQLLEFLHHSEAAAAQRFAQYALVLTDDARTRAVFEDVLRDEKFHVAYTKNHLARLTPHRSRRAVWRGRLRRSWRGYLRCAAAVAAVLSAVVLTLQYFILLPPFAWLAHRSARRQTDGWTTRARRGGTSLKSQV